jgi:hypothetical protein
MTARVSPETSGASTLRVGGTTRASYFRGSQSGRSAESTPRLDPGTRLATAHLDGK